MFEPAELLLARHLVNGGVAALVIFMAACSPAQEPSEETPARTPPSGGANRAEVELQVVWSTRPLERSIVDLAIAGDADPLIAALDAAGGITLYNLDGEQASGRGDLGASAIAAGVTTSIEGTPLTLFPGVTNDQQIVAYVYNPTFGAPISLELPISAAGVEGLCADPSPRNPDALLDLSYWTGRSPPRLFQGSLSEVDGALAWRPWNDFTTDDGIGACVAFSGTAETAVMQENPSAALEAAGGSIPVLEVVEGRLKRSDLAQTITLSDGLSSAAPREITALAANADIRRGGFQNGVIAIAGPAASGSGDQIVFVNPAPLTAPER